MWQMEVERTTGERESKRQARERRRRRKKPCLGWIRLDDSNVLWTFWALEMHFLLICADDLEPIAFEYLIDKIQELDDIPQKLCGDALAGRIDGDLTSFCGF